MMTFTLVRCYTGPERRYRLPSRTLRGMFNNRDSFVSQQAAKRRLCEGAATSEDMRILQRMIDENNCVEREMVKVI